MYTIIVTSPLWMTILCTYQRNAPLLATHYPPPGHHRGASLSCQIPTLSSIQDGETIGDLTNTEFMHIKCPCMGLGFLYQSPYVGPCCAWEGVVGHYIDRYIEWVKSLPLMKTCMCLVISISILNHGHWETSPFEFNFKQQHSGN